MGADPNSDGLPDPTAPADLGTFIQHPAEA
jgi:hypothetical protein